MTQDELKDNHAIATALAAQITMLQEQYATLCANLAKECPVAIGTKVQGEMRGGNVRGPDGRILRDEQGYYVTKKRVILGEVIHTDWSLSGWKVFIAAMTKDGVRSQSFRGEWVRVRGNKLAERNDHNWRIA